MSSKPSEIEVCAKIARSGFLDASYYLAQNPDVEASGMDPILHYVRFGERELRNPSRDFDIQMHKPLYHGKTCILYQHILKLEEERLKPSQA